jgi:hypothetical protein
MMLTCLWNRHLWNEEGTTIQAIMDRPQPAPVVVEVVDEMQDGGQLSTSNIAQLIAISY